MQIMTFVINMLQLTTKKTTTKKKNEDNDNKLLQCENKNNYYNKLETIFEVCVIN